MAFWNRKDRREEFEAAALPHLDALYRTAFCRMGEAAAAEDAVQETYLKAWRSFSTFEPGTNCRAWLFRILSNAVHDQRKKRAREHPADDSERILLRLPDRRAGGGDYTGVARALEDLPADQRAAVLLSDVEGLTYRETADALGIPVGTVMSRLSRARARLRKSLGRGYGDAARDRKWIETT